IINVVGDVGEEEGAGVGRGFRGIDGGDADCTALNLLEDGGGGFEVEDFTHALAIGFQQHGKAGKAGGDGEKIRGAFALLPERGAYAGAAAREKQRASGGFAKFGGEERGAAELAEDEIF